MKFTALEKVMLANIKKKVEAGKNPTASEKELWERFEESQAEPLEKRAESMLTSRPTIAVFFSVVEKTISEWVKQGMPKEAYGTYDLKKCFDWWLENINAGREDSDSSIVAIKKQYWAEKVIEQKRKNAVGAGLLMSKEEINKGWTERAADLRQSLLALPSRMGPILAMKSSEEISILIMAEARRMLESYVRQGAFMPKKRERKERKNERQRPS